MAPENVNWESLTKEKSLWQLYVLSRSIRHSRFNGITLLVVMGILIIQIYLTPLDAGGLKAIVVKLAESSMAFALNILGFLMAGFTIFATLSKPTLLLAMHRVPYGKTGISYLQYNFLSFVRVFIYFLSFTAICIVVNVLAQDWGVFSRFALSLPEDGRTIRLWTLRATLVTVGLGWAIILLSLKSFVFDIYHVIMTGLRFEAEHPDLLEKPSPSKEILQKLSDCSQSLEDIRRTCEESLKASPETPPPKLPLD